MMLRIQTSRIEESWQAEKTRQKNEADVKMCVAKESEYFRNFNTLITWVMRSNAYHESVLD